MDDGLGGSFNTIVGSIDHSTFTYHITTGLVVGNSYRIQVTAINAVGSVIGNIITVIAANAPEAPAIGPYKVVTETNAT